MSRGGIMFLGASLEALIVTCSLAPIKDQESMIYMAPREVALFGQFEYGFYQIVEEILWN